MAKSKTRKIALTLMPFAVIMGLLVYGAFALGQQNSGQSIVEAQDPLFTGHGWLVKPFNKLKIDNFDTLGVNSGCVLYSKLGSGDGSVTVVQLGDRITHTYTSAAQLKVCGNVVHLPPSVVPAVLEDDDDK